MCFLRKSPFNIHKSEEYCDSSRKIIIIIYIGWFYYSNLHFFHIGTYKAWYHTIINIILTINAKKTPFSGVPVFLFNIVFLKTEFHVWYPDNDWKKKQAPPFRQYIRYRFIVITFYRHLIMFYLILVYIMPIIEQNGGNSYGIYSRYSRQSCSYYTV